jgi:hypothetical protein
MGYSIRTDRYRYTIWMKDDFRSTQAYNNDLVIARELYDYKKDPNETVNVIDDGGYVAVTKEMNEKMMSFLATQVKKK